jgi:hypothetical protein
MHFSFHQTSILTESYLDISFANNKKIKIIINKASGIQNGLSTHHQDQSILFINFKTIKTIPKRLGIDALNFMIFSN